MYVFQISDWNFFADTLPIKKKLSRVNGQYFYHSPCKNSAWTHIFKYTDALHSDDFILFTSAKVFLEDRRTLSPKIMHRVCCFRWCQHIPSWTVVVWSEFVSLVSCILPPLCRFRAATYHPQLQTHHIGRWLTSVKFWCKVDVHWCNTLFGPIRTGCILKPRKWLEICKCQRTITPHQRSMIGFAGNKLAFVHIAISVLSGNFVRILRNIGKHLYCRPISVLIQSNTDG